jgi:hypothetical protein
MTEKYTTEEHKQDQEREINNKYKQEEPPPLEIDLIITYYIRLYFQ